MYGRGAAGKRWRAPLVARRRFVALFEHGRAEGPVARASVATRCLQGLVFVRAGVEPIVQVFGVADRFVCLHVVPDLMRQALNIVGQIACELDNRRADGRPGLEARGLEDLTSVNAANRSAGIFCSSHAKVPAL